MSTTAQNQNQGDQDLVDLQPDQQSIIKRILVPKVIILVFFSLIFVSKNIYNMINQTSEPAPPPVEEPPVDEEIMDRMYWYCIATVVMFVAYIFLVRANDKALLKKLEAEKKKKEDEEKELQQSKKKDRQNQQSQVKIIRDEKGLKKIDEELEQVD